MRPAESILSKYCIKVFQLYEDNGDFDYDHWNKDDAISLESVVPAVDNLLDLPALPQQLQRHQTRLIVPILMKISNVKSFPQNWTFVNDTWKPALPQVIM